MLNELSTFHNNIAVPMHMKIMPMLWNITPTEVLSNENDPLVKKKTRPAIIANVPITIEVSMIYLPVYEPNQLEKGSENNYVTRV
jgi:hypothetical protein